MRAPRTKRGGGERRPVPHENELWLLDELFAHGGAALYLFCPCVVEMHANREAPWADGSVDTPTDALVSLRDREWVEFTRGAKAFDPSRRSIREAISSHECDRRSDSWVCTVVGLTPFGVAAWEREFEPDWDRYIEVRVTRRDSRRFHLRSRRREVLARAIRNFGPAGVVVDWSSVVWSPPRSIGGAEARRNCSVLRWRSPEPMHGVYFSASRPPGARRDEVFVGDVEAACPRWCSPFSHLSTWRGRAAME